MPPPPTTPSPLRLWLEDALPKWLLPAAGIVAVVLVFVLTELEVLSDRYAALAVFLAFAVTMAYAIVEPGWRIAAPWGRPVTAVATALALLVAVYGFAIAVFPGEPVARGELTPDQRKFTLPSPGAYRFLVSGKLAGQGETQGEYALKAGTSEVHGEITRTYVRRSFRRGGGVSVPREHDINSHMTVVRGAAEVTLEKVGKEIEGALHVAAYPVLPPWVVYLVIALAVALSAVVDVAAVAKGRCALVGGTAGAFALIMGRTTPDQTVGPTFGAALVAFAIGAAVGWIASRLARALPLPLGEAKKAVVQKEKKTRKPR